MKFNYCKKHIIAYLSESCYLCFKENKKIKKNNLKIIKQKKQFGKIIFLNKMKGEKLKKWKN